MKFKLSRSKIFVLAIVALLAARWFFFRAPSESQMIADFHAHKAQFEQLRLMLAQDKNVKIIAPSFTLAQLEKKPDYVETYELPLNVSPARLQLYRARMKELGILQMYVDQRRNLIRFARFGGGFTDTSWNIGYAYSPETPKPLVKSAYNQYPGKYKTHFTRIEGDWYIYHSR